MTEQRTNSEFAERPMIGRAWILGNVLLAGGLIWLIVDRLLSLRYPLRWGGPNIGGGALVLFALLAVAAGAVMVVAVVVGRVTARRARRRHLPDRGMAGGTGTGWRSGVAPVLAHVLLVAVLFSLLARSGDEGPAGAVGVTVTEAGSPVLVVAVCHGSVDTLTVVGPNRGRDPNEELARLSSQTALPASTTVDVTRPTSQWTGSSLPSSRPALLTATASGPRGSLREVSFTPADLASLDPATVLYSTAGPTGDIVAQRAPIGTFSSLACAGASTLSGTFAHVVMADAGSGAVRNSAGSCDVHLSKRAGWGAPRILAMGPILRGRECA